MKKPLPFLDKSVPEAWDRRGDVRREGAEAAGLQALHLDRAARTPLPARTLTGLADLLRAL